MPKTFLHASKERAHVLCDETLPLRETTFCRPNFLARLKNLVDLALVLHVQILLHLKTSKNAVKICDFIFFSSRFIEQIY